MTSLKTPQEIIQLKESGRILAGLLKKLVNHAKIGTNLIDLDQIAYTYIRDAGGQPAFLNYKPEGAVHPYPASICTSLNNTIVHGAPHNYTLRSGDVLKIDAGVIYEGMYTDAATTVALGRVSLQTKKLLYSTRKALDEAVAILRPGKTLGDIGWTIERRAQLDGMKVIKALTGHGVGYELHEDPVIFNYGNKGQGLVLREGMVLAIEPMFSISSEDIIQQRDESYATYDGSIAAHYEHTVVITKRGHTVITS